MVLELEYCKNLLQSLACIFIFIAGIFSVILQFNSILMVVIRLSEVVKRPFHNITVADSRYPRDGRL